MGELESLWITDRNPSQEGRFKQLLSEAGIPFSESNGKVDFPGYGSGGNNASRSSFYSAVSASRAAAARAAAPPAAMAAPVAPAPTAEEIIRKASEERNAKYKEQAQVWNEFMSSPTFWDAILARQMSEQYFNPYYQTVLEEFVNPLQTKIRQSQENETRLLGELTRVKEAGTKEQQESMMGEIEKAQGGFAGAGVYGGGGARRSVARTKISGERTLQDFLDRVGAQGENVQAEEGSRRELLTGDIAQKGRDITRERTGAIEEDIGQQKTLATKQQATRAHEAISGKFGEFLLNVPDWLQLA